MEEKNIKDTIRAKAAEAAEAAAEAAETQDKEEYGDIRIADEVICIVASLAAQEVPGVVGMSGGLTDALTASWARRTLLRAYICILKARR